MTPPPADDNSPAESNLAPPPNSHGKANQRNYENKSVPELRSLAKGALLSLKNNKILYAELLREDIDAEMLKSLYRELNIQVDATRLDDEARISATSEVSAEQQNAIAIAVPASSAPATIGDPAAESGSLLPGGLRKPTTTASPNLERKDRIAQLLAAKTGRPSPGRSVSSSAVSVAAVHKIAPPAQALKRPSPREAAASASKVATETKVSAGIDTDLSMRQTEQPVEVTELQGTLTRSNTDVIGTSGNGAANVLSSPSSIPGLFMASAESLKIGQDMLSATRTQLEVSNSHKRTREDFENDASEPTAKRQNTWSTTANDEPMDLDGPEDGDASEG